MAQDCGTHCPPAGPCLDGPEQDPEPGAAPGAALERSQIPAAPAGQAQPCREQRRGLGNPGGRNEGIIEVTGTVLLRAQREPGEPQIPARLQDRHKFREKGILGGAGEAERGKNAKLGAGIPRISDLGMVPPHRHPGAPRKSQGCH